ncbi:MAG: response regulator, partial [Sinomicrobium sp.]|nr:response regulator [Sinomicrobium sp.]
KGSVFTLSLPQSLVRNPGKALSPEVRTMPPALLDTPVVSVAKKTNERPHILLVEDNPDMRQYIRNFMNNLYIITEATDGLEALEVLKKITPDLIISDIMMPRMDGITLAKTLKEDKRLKNIPFITLTAKADEAGKVAALRTGIDDYLTKPFNAEELAARAANLIRNYGVRKTTLLTANATVNAPAYQDTMIAAMKDTVLQHLEDAAFTADELAASRNMSLSSLRRLLKGASGLSPGQFIREIRLQQARRLLEAKQYPSVAEVMYAVGFEKASYFARLFSERFGKNPSEYL